MLVAYEKTINVKILKFYTFFNLFNNERKLIYKTSCFLNIKTTIKSKSKLQKKISNNQLCRITFIKKKKKIIINNKQQLISLKHF